MSNWSRHNTVSFEETPISSQKYNAEVDRIYTALNSVDTRYRGTAAPSGKDSGTLWEDTNASPSVNRVFDGGIWRWFGIWTGVEADRPANPKTGAAMWINSVNGNAAVWSGSAWAAMGNASYAADIALANSHRANANLHVASDGILPTTRLGSGAAPNGYALVSDGAGGTVFLALGQPADFLFLNDTPSSYSGQKGKAVLVNEAEDALEFGAASGGGGSFVNLLHSAGNYSTTDTTYAVVASGQFIADTSRHSATLKVLIERAVSVGTGQVKVTVSDGTNSASAETATFTNTTAAQEFLEVDCSTLTTGLLWTVTVEAKNTGGTTTVSRIKVFALPANDAPSQTALCIAPAATFNATAYGSALDTQYFLAHQFHADGNSLIEFPVKVSLGSGVTAAMVKVVVTGTFGGSTTSEQAEATFSAAGIQTLRVPYPDIAASQLKVEVFGKVTGGSGFGTLDHYEARILM